MAPRVNKITIRKYFNIENNQAACKLCTHTLKADRLFNLKTHIIKVHNIKEENFAKEKSSSVNHKHHSKIKNRNQMFRIEISKKLLFRSYIGLVIEDSIRLDILNSENLQNILNPIFQGLGRRTGKFYRLNSSNIEKHVEHVAASIREALKNELKPRLLSLKIDSATQLSPNMFAISAQFIQDSEIQTRVLGMIELKDADASITSKLAAEILKTLAKFEINLSQLHCITSNNGANMVLPHCGIFVDDHDDEVEAGNEIYLMNLKMSEDFSAINLGEMQICPSAAYTAQLCVLDVTKDVEIKKFIISCRNLTRFIKNPLNGYEATFELKGLALPQLDCATRWGSTYKMIQTLKNAKDVLVEIENSLQDNFWDYVEAYCLSFEPLQNTIIKFQTEQLHYGDFYAEWLKCKICTNKLLEKIDKPFVKKIAGTLLHSMEIRQTQLLDNENLISCLYLDPRFHHTLTATQKQDAAMHLNKLYERIKPMGIPNEESRTKFPSLTMHTEDLVQEDEDDLLNAYLTQNLKPTGDNCPNVYSKILNLQLPFLRAGSNVLKFWRDKQYTEPELYDLSEICFAVPAGSTQATLEGALSSLKHIVAGNRNQINHDTLENILLVKLNTSFIDKAIDTLPLFADDQLD
uniref:HAT C-terminal dimerisation domain-containing protein n=1 Tax=Stomoxys calcitrans TaxID=35570 RepID=A0A1I8PD83_STOCA